MKSLFAKYFSISAIVSVLSFVILGGIFLFKVNRFATAERSEILQKTLERAVDTTTAYIHLRIDGEGILSSLESDRVFALYMNNMKQIAESDESTVFICDETGTILMVADKNGCYTPENEQIPQRVIRAVDDGQKYLGVSNMGGYLNELSFMIGRRADVATDEGIIVFAAISASRNLDLFYQLSRYFVIMTFAVLLFTLFVTVIVVRQMVKPLKQMANVARSFARGDFSVRVKVPKYKTEMYELATNFNSMADSVENMELTRRGLVANVAHDLRTPMTTIAGFVDGMIDGTIRPDNQEHYLKIVSDEIKRLSRMANSILETSRLESGEKALNYTDFDISEIVRRIIIGFEQKLSEKNVEFYLDMPERLIISADHDAIFQVIYNLADNALKFIDSGGKLAISMHEKSSQVHFSISNTGAQIPKESQKYIFDRFYKGEQSRTDSRSGSGLGLYIVKTIVNRHGGDVSVKSEHDITEFNFTIPSEKQ